MWSVGVLIYLLLSGSFPFYNETFEKMSANIINCNLKFPADAMSPEGKTLISQLLLGNPTERISASECCLSPWITQSRRFTSPLDRTRIQKYLGAKSLENGLRRYTAATTTLSPLNKTEG